MIAKPNLLSLVALLPPEAERRHTAFILLILLTFVSVGVIGLVLVRQSVLLRRFLGGILVAGTLLLILPLLLPSVARVPDARAGVTMQERAKQIVLAMHNYSANHNGKLPPAVLSSKDGKPLHSWRVLLLPYLGEEELYRQFHLDEPWDSPHNLTLLRRMPRDYAPLMRDDGSVKPHTTFFRVFVGKGTAFEGSEGLRMPEDFPDGTVNTILVVEAGEAVPWTMPSDLEYSLTAPCPSSVASSPARADFATSGRTGRRASTLAWRMLASASYHSTSARQL